MQFLIGLLAITVAHSSGGDPSCLRDALANQSDWLSRGVDSDVDKSVSVLSPDSESDRVVSSESDA